MTARRLKVLADFDGVWTNLRGQAEAVDDARVLVIAERAGWRTEAVEACLQAVGEAIQARPLEHGWRIDGRITAYADEDPFLLHNATVSGIGLLARAGHPGCQALEQALRAKGVENLSAFGSEIFMAASHRFLSRAGHDLLPEATSVLKGLLERADVVFCTNFEPLAIRDTWARNGFRARVVGEEASPEHTPGLTLRGSAQKQTLTGDPQRLVDLGGRPIGVDRGHYRKALEAEAPDMVVGDVFSLDLALPLTMRGEVPGYEKLTGVLFRTPFSPSWTLELARSGGQPGLVLIEALPELLTLVDRLSLEG